MLPIISNKGYLKRFQTFFTGERVFEWQVRANTGKGRKNGVMGLGNVYFPAEFIGKKFRIKLIEVVEVDKRKNFQDKTRKVYSNRRRRKSDKKDLP